jgi:hypothetical protein
MLGFRSANDLRNVFAGTYRSYVYSTPVTAVPAAGSVQAVTSIDSMTDFVCTALVAVCLYGDLLPSAAADPDANRQVDFFTRIQPRIEVIDSGSGASIFDRSDVVFDNIWGTAEDPFELMQPHVFIARSVITTIMVNIDAVRNYKIQVGFRGYKVPAGRM